MRPGHHRPLGTQTKLRFPDWPSRQPEPALGDVISQTDELGGDHRVREGMRRRAKKAATGSVRPFA